MSGCWHVTDASVLIMHKKFPSLMRLNLQRIWKISDGVLKNLCTFPDGGEEGGLQVLPNLTSLNVSDFDTHITIAGVRYFLERRKGLDKFVHLRVLSMYIPESSPWVPLIAEILKA